jgi:hypothetical protein
MVIIVLAILMPRRLLGIPSRAIRVTARNSSAVDTFEEESETKKKLSKLEAVRELWRKKGLIEKFHNTVSFIRKTP